MNSRGLSILAGALLGFAIDAGAVHVWDGSAGDRQWTNALNWDLDTLPYTNDETRINAASSEALPVQIAGGSTALASPVTGTVVLLR